MAGTGAEHAEAVRAEYEALGAEVRGELAKLTPGEFALPSGNEGWTVQKVAAHLAGASASFVLPLRRVAGGKGIPKVPAFVLNIGNAIGSFRSRNMDVDGMLRTYDKGHARMAAAIGETASADWEREVSVFGHKDTLESFLRDVVLRHEREHLEQLRGRGAD